MLAAVVCATLCGARGYSAIVQWLHALPVPWWHRLGFTRRPPKGHAFRDLLDALPPQTLEGVVGAWVSAAWGAAISEETFASGGRGWQDAARDVDAASASG